jgi:hypothetical protein
MKPAEASAVKRQVLRAKAEKSFVNLWFMAEED